MTTEQQVIYSKLERFIRKFHLSELIKGSLLFICIGVLYFLATVLIEYFLWLSNSFRFILFVFFIVIESLLFIRFITLPLLRLFKIRGGLSYDDASLIIGNHFSDVSDTLINFLQLSDQNNSNNSSELVIASINQKASQLEFIPFVNSINLKKSFLFLPLAFLLLFGLSYLFVLPSSPLLSDSYHRLVRYDETFYKPAPFQFILNTDEINVVSGNDYTLKFSIEGTVLPEQCQVLINGDLYFAQKLSANTYEYTFSSIQNDINFNLVSNTVTSPSFAINVINVPIITDLTMNLVFPDYLNRAEENINGSGNAVVPEGTIINWHINTVDIDQVNWVAQEQTLPFANSKPNFSFSKKIHHSVSYSLVTSNNVLTDYEKLDFNIQVINDQYPSLVCHQLPDSLAIADEILFGDASDDYGLHSLSVNYYPTGQPDLIRSIALPIASSTHDRFKFSLTTLDSLIAGQSYDYYFELKDNDVQHNYKSTRSQLFSINIQTNEEKLSNNLLSQSNTAADITESLEKQKQRLSLLDDLEKESLSKRSFNYSKQQEINDFLNQQERDDFKLKTLSKKLSNSLKDFDENNTDPLKKELLDRLKKNQESLDKNQKLLDEIKKLNDQIKQDKLSESLSKLKNNTKSQSKSLEQLLELTKKFYVEKKMELLSKELDQLSKDQESLSKKEHSTQVQEQQQINEQFEAIKQSLSKLKEDNKSLKSPLSLPDDQPLEDAITNDLDKSLEEIKDSKSNNAKKSQKSASDKMKEMSSKMQSSMSDQAMEQLEEDVEMLRQILDNLLTYSFSQEELLNQFMSIQHSSPSYPDYLKEQHFLKSQFKHIDDSLYALSMRNPVITDVIIKEISSVYYNTDQAIVDFTESKISSGVAHQQYVISSTNVLANLLSNALNNMQMNLSSSGSGKPKKGKGSGEPQLSDIIKGQQGLSEKMQQGSNGEKSKQGPPKGNDKDGSKPGGMQGSEGMSNELFEVYKQQQNLRESLEQLLNNKGLNAPSGQATLNNMKSLEKQLLNKGITRQTMQQAAHVNQQLLKLEKAIRKQGESNQRKANSNTKEYSDGNTNSLPPAILDYIKSIEILNRETLPLNKAIDSKVQYYFKTK